MPASMAVDFRDVLHIATGITQVLRFNPTFGALELSGLFPPTQAPSLSGSGQGNIIGDYFAYTRWIDRDGNISSFSPLSAKFTAERTTTNLTDASNTSPIVIDAGGFGEGQIIKISGVTGNTAANGTFYAKPHEGGGTELWIDAATATVGNGEYLQGGVVSTGYSKLIYSNVQAPTESKVAKRQILRNADGDGTVFYVDIETTDVTSTVFESLATSTDLITRDPVPLKATDGRSLVDKTPPPDWKKVIAFFQGRMFLAGIEPYSEGAVAIQHGSTLVTGLCTEWNRDTFPGRFIEFVGGDKQYTIASVSSETSLELTEPYGGTTGPYASYTIHPGDGERRLVYWSEAQEPEAFPIQSTLAIESDPGAGDITSLFPHRSWVYIGAENRIYRLSFVKDPDPALGDGYTSKASKRGCVNQRCWVNAEDAVFAMDYGGIHAFYGNDDQDLGTPAIQDMFDRNPQGPYRINWRAKRYFHAVYDPGSSVVRWFVSLSGNYTPHHAIAYHIRLKRWWLEEYPFPIASSCLGRLNGRPQVFLGSNAGRIFALGAGPLDGPAVGSGTLRGTVTSSGILSLTDSTASFPTSGLVGNPVYIVRGKGKGQRRTIVSATGTTLTVKEPWLDKPDATSSYQIGGVQWHWRSGMYRWASDANSESVRAVQIKTKRTTQTQELFLRVFSDLEDAAKEWALPTTLAAGDGIALLENDPITDLSIDTTKNSGYVVKRLDGFREPYGEGERYVAIELHGVTNAEPQRVLSAVIDGAR